MTETLAQRVVRWQREHGRHDLPWQNTRDPYRVWLSEIMLQQTQVSTVLDYFDRFLVRFPDVAALAAAEQDEVLGLWSGLGYYSRARNLHACARQVMALHGGAFPRSAELLATLPGIGRSTAAAIASFCFDERVAILDGNVKRVLTRALGFGDDLAVAAHERRLWDLATDLLPEAPAVGGDAGRSPDMPAYTQGLMDLGATVCTTRKPACLLCPLQATCKALAEASPSVTRCAPANSSGAPKAGGCCGWWARKARCGCSGARKKASGPGWSACLCSTARPLCRPARPDCRCGRCRLFCMCSPTAICTCTRCNGAAPRPINRRCRVWRGAGWLLPTGPPWACRRPCGACSRRSDSAAQ